jgi:protein transport protein SEC24
MMVVSDISESFMPLQSGFLVDPKESRYFVGNVYVREVIESLLDTIPVIFGSNRLAEPALGAALTAGFEALVLMLFN